MVSEFRLSNRIPSKKMETWKRLNYIFHGLAPRGYHVINIALHALTTGLFVATAVKCLHAKLCAATVAGLLFATHSIHSEAVAGIVGRADILATLFYLLSFRAYNKYVQNDIPGISSPNSQLRSCIFAGIAMLCKEHGLTVIAVSSLWDVLSHRNGVLRLFIFYREPGTNSENLGKNSNNPLNRATALISMGIPLLLFRIWIMGSELPSFSDQENPAAASPSIITRFLTWSYLPILNLFLLISPIRLSYDWQLGTVPLVESVLDLRVLYSAVAYYVLAILAVKILQKGESAEIWCLLTIVVPFLPAANILSPVGFVVAERLLYLPSTGFCLLIGQGFEKLWSQFRRRNTARAFLALNFLIVLTALSCRTWTRNFDWLSREALFTSGLGTFPQNGKMHYNFANLQKDFGRREQAIIHYEEAIRLWPTHASAHNNLGTLLVDSQAAKIHFEEALNIYPKHANALYNLATIYRNEGNTTLSVRLLESCLKIEPFHREALTMMGDILADKGDIKRVYIVNLFIKEAHRRRGNRRSTTSELWNNLSRTVDGPPRNVEEPPNILQYLTPNHVDKIRFLDHPVSGSYKQR